MKYCKDVQALAEVRGDRGLDDLPRRLGHEPPHPGELAHLLLAAARPGVRHHVDGVELAAALIDLLHLLEHLLGIFFVTSDQMAMTLL